MVVRPTPGPLPSDRRAHPAPGASVAAGHWTASHGACLDRACRDKAIRKGLADRAGSSSLSAEGLPVSKTAWRVGVSAIRDVIAVSSNRPMHTMPSNQGRLHPSPVLRGRRCQRDRQRPSRLGIGERESLGCLLEIDAHVVELNREGRRWPRRVVEVAQVRWGLVSAVTAVDRCAAAAAEPPATAFKQTRRHRLAPPSGEGRALSSGPPRVGSREPIYDGEDRPVSRCVCSPSAGKAFRAPSGLRGGPRMA